jgi:hypothetical protein
MMFRLILFSLSSLLFYLTPVNADLYYDTYQGTGARPSFPGNGGSLTYSTKLSSGTVNQLNYHWGSGNVLDSGRSQTVIVNFYGYITIPSTGSQDIQFYLYADDGVYMKIDSTVVISDWNEQGAGTWNYISTDQTLTGGSTYYIDAWWYENGGAAAFKLYWDQTGSVALVPSSAYSLTDPSASSATPSYSSGPTSAQQTRITNAISNATTSGEGSKVDVDVTGNDNTIYIDQAGEPSYLLLDVIGNTNIVDIDQDATGTTGYGHYSEVLIDGDRNDLDLLQSGAGNKAAFVDIDGNDNVLDIIQKDGGSHYLQLDLIGDDHDVDVTQEGSGGHAATIELTNSGGGWDFDLTQSGSTNKTYSLPHSMSDGTTTSGTCSNVVGCSLSVIQND